MERGGGWGGGWVFFRLIYPYSHLGMTCCSPPSRPEKDKVKLRCGSFSLPGPAREFKRDDRVAFVFNFAGDRRSVIAICLVGNFHRVLFRACSQCKYSLSDRELSGFRSPRCLLGNCFSLAWRHVESYIREVFACAFFFFFFQLFLCIFFIKQPPSISMFEVFLSAWLEGKFKYAHNFMLI